MTDRSGEMPTGAMGRATILVLALLSAAAPLATDMYLPGFPQMSTELSASASGVQLTLTTFLVGLSLGQLLIGSLSDQWGRRSLLLFGGAVATVAGVVCALAPNVATLIGARFIQGLGAAAGIVLARAVVSDRASGAGTARVFGVLMVVQAVASVLAPPLGGAFVGAVGWRGLLWTLTVVTALLLVASHIFVPESLPAHARRGRGLRELGRGVSSVLRNRRYLGFTLTFTLSFAALFSYIAASPFVLQTILGLSPFLYSVAFGVNALGLVVTSVVSTVLVKRVGAGRLLAGGLTVLALSSVSLALAVFVANVPLWPTLVSTFLVMSSMGFILGNATSLATEQVSAEAGAGSAVLGALQFGLGALVSPIVGVAGKDDARPMAITVLVATMGAVLATSALARRPAPGMFSFAPKSVDDLSRPDGQRNGLERR